jgi:hypothetical protein
VLGGEPSHFNIELKERRKMKPTTKKWFAIAALVCGSAAACASPCDDLKEQCSSCEDATTKTACETIVNGDNGDACQAALDTKQYEKDSALCKGLSGSTVTVGAGGGGS